MRHKAGRHRHIEPNIIQKAAAGSMPAVMTVATAAAGASGFSSLATIAPTAAHVAAVPVQAVPASLTSYTRPLPQITDPVHTIAHHTAPAIHRIEHTVATGETLAGIAKEYCGKASDWPIVYRENKRVIGGNPDLIYTGEHLTLDCSHVQAAQVTRHHKDEPDHDGDDRSQASMASYTAPSTCSTQPNGMLPANFRTIFKFLRAHGYTANAAAGILGNIYGESGGNPESVGSGGGGLIGWTPLSVPVTGNCVSDLQAQMQDLLGYINSVGSRSDINSNSPTPADAATYFCYNYEKPADPAGDSPLRDTVADAVASALGF